jgi:hypothetical protein
MVTASIENRGITDGMGLMPQFNLLGGAKYITFQFTLVS